MNIIEEIKKIANINSIEGCTDEQIITAEKELDIILPQEYIDYVKTFGCIDFDGIEWTGLNIEGRLNVVNATKKEMSVNDDFPKGFFVLENMGIDGKVTVVDKDGNVYLLQYDKLDKIANSISEYLKIRVENNN